MATVRVGSIVLRVDDLQQQMAFWTAALDYVPREDPDVDSVVLRPRTGNGPNLRITNNWIHEQGYYNGSITGNSGSTYIHGGSNGSLLYKNNFWLGRMGVTVFAQSAVDMALWDIIGKRAGLPLFRLWGAARSEIPAYGSGCFRGLGRDGMIARAREFTAQGLKAIKMQVAHIRPWREDVQNVKAMREAMGGGIEIMIDVNMGWDADTAIQAGHRIDEFDPYWLEEPVVAEDFTGYRRIAAALKTRIVGGESHFTRNDLRPFFETPCVPILQPDPMRGGYSELRKIAAAAEPWGIRLAPHLFHETMVHVLAAIPNASYLEYMDWNDDLWIEPVLPSKDGTMSPPERPGHGLAFRPEILKDHRKGGQRLTG